MPELRFADAERDALLDVARRSLEHGLRYAAPLPVRPEGFPAPLHECRASFVTLRSGGALRGCVGRLRAVDSLVCEVAGNAFRSGFRDSRFPPLEDHELPQLEIHVSVLSPPEPLACRSEAELLALLRPGEDGLVVREGVRTATFLPAVWGMLPDPAAFVRELRRKAGIAADGWGEGLRFERYRAVELCEEAGSEGR